MKKFKEYKQVNIPAIEAEVLDFWRKEKIFEKTVTTRESNPSFTFYEGPPSANGTPGIHHVMARTVKDLFCRYRTLKGFQVKRKGGWDTHGLPVELQVEKQLGITKEDIGKKITVEEYNRQCREAVMKFTDQWEQLTEQMGYWVDMSDPYITYKSEYIESLWNLLKKLYDKDLLYKGYTIQPYSPAAGTGLSTHELNQPGSYREVKDISITTQFKIKGTERDYFLAWTTTPWTLPANSALAINNSIDYIKVSTFNPYTGEPMNAILAKARLDYYFNQKAKDIPLEDYNPGDKLIPFKVIEEFKGKELNGMEYEQLLPYVPLPHPAFTVVHGDFVSTEDGTGIVHLSKTFGADDYKTSVKYGIPGVFVKDEEGNEVPIVDKRGRFVNEITDFAGMFVKNYDDQDESDPNYKSTDTLIAIKLKEENKAFKVEKYIHSYPHCWRTDKPVLYYPLDAWFIKTTAAKERLVELNNTINWKPESTGIGRFGNWLENLEDWNLSRSRFWGTPLPIWVNEDRTELKCIGSFEELRSEVNKSIEAGFMEEQLPNDFDPHRPFVDNIVLVSSKGEKMFREPDLIDVWFDSGAMPYAQWHYPFENQEIFKDAYPADFIAEGVDQTRGWFFTLHAIAGMLFDSVAFKNVVANGLVLDKDGNKMSKRLGNAVDPFVTLSEHGADPTRWYMISNANPWDNLKFDLEGVIEVKRRFFGTLQNTYSFFALYANIDNYDGRKPSSNSFAESDRWILSRLNSLIKQVDEEYENFEPTKATRAIQDFVIDELSNWYVRLNRKRFWRGELNEDKLAAFYTLYNCLLGVSKMMAPVAPFTSDQLFKDLTENCVGDYPESVHLSDFPVSDVVHIDEELETRMDLAQNITSLVHALRRKHKIKVRQPLQKILIPVLDKKFKERIDSLHDLIISEINTKEIEFIEDTSGVLVKRIKPNFRKLGKVHGPRMKEISAAVAKLSGAEITEIDQSETYTLSLPNGDLVLERDDFEISFEDIPGWSVASNSKVTVALDINITEELRQEGLARDIVNRVQNMRKDKGLDVQDKIRIGIEKNGELLTETVNNFKDYISTETQALELVLEDEVKDGQVFDIDNYVVKIRIEA